MQNAQEEQLGQRIVTLEIERERGKEKAAYRVDVVGSNEGEGVGGRWQVVGSGRDKTDFEKAAEGGKRREGSRMRRREMQ